MSHLFQKFNKISNKEKHRKRIVARCGRKNHVKKQVNLKSHYVLLKQIDYTNKK
jgi:hypothetical protein